jgi:IS30 family transposase
VRTYKQLTQGKRYQIFALLKIGQKQTQIALAVGVCKSTISRELRRNRGQRGYRPQQAHQKALNRRKRNKLRIGPASWVLIEEKLRLDWSPEQISGWLKKHMDVRISHEWIYPYVYADKRVGGDLHKPLRCQKKRRKRYGSRYGSYDRRGKIPNRKSIEVRPEIVEKRTRLGDWEKDTIIGKGHRGAVVTLTDRKSRLTLLGQVDQKKAGKVAATVIALLQNIPHCKTLTADNGTEFAGHERIANSLGCDIYFAHPYSSWERGTNENTNGLIRQYMPKDRDLTTVKAQEALMIIERLNHRPRKCLDFRTSFEVFYQYNFVALDS